MPKIYNDEKIQNLLKMLINTYFLKSMGMIGANFAM